MNIISGNPYRLLGTFSNSSIKDRIANTNKIKAYLKVGKSVSFPIDLANLMSAPVRTLESMEHTNGCINLPQDQLKYALFWFIKSTSIDEIAFGYLQQGDVVKAKELFEKKETSSSLINRGVLALIQNDAITAIQCITKVIHDDDYRTAFVEAVCGSTFQISEESLAQLFIDELLIEMPMQELMQLFWDNGASADDDSYLKNKVVAEQMVIINTEINHAKSVRNSDSDAQYRAGCTLMNRTKEPLSIIRSFLDTEDAQYQMIVDNLAKQILQCGINYYNNSQEHDAPNKAIVLQKYALYIAVGKLTKDRCRKNVTILQNVIEQLPPLEVEEEARIIKEELNKYSQLPDKISYAIHLMVQCAPSVMRIKEKLGVSHKYYLKISTQIVDNSLHNVIEEVNSINNDQLSLKLALHRVATMELLERILKEAWKAILCMDKFDIEAEFQRDRYLPNRKLLKSLIDSTGISVLYIGADIDLRTESEIYNSCRTNEDYSSYIKRFPMGKFVNQAKAKIEERIFINSKTKIDFQRYLRLYPAGKYIVQAKESIFEIEKAEEEAERTETECFNSCNTAEDYKRYLSQYPGGKYMSKAKDIIEKNKTQSTFFAWVTVIAIIIILICFLLSN